MVEFKTPGYFVEQVPRREISFAPDTALPVIFGYTETYRDSQGLDLREGPVRISSYPEYRELFGGSAPHTVNTVALDLNYDLTSLDIQQAFYTSDAVRAFFANGGVSIMILSLGDYNQVVTKQDFQGALAKLDKIQEPTLLFAPDALLLPGNEYYEVQKAILQHCNRHHDRFAIMDVPESATIADPVTDFRDKIGLNYLDFGAAYFPWLRTDFEKEISYKDLYQQITRFGDTVELKTLTNNPFLIQMVVQLELNVVECQAIEAAIRAILDSPVTEITPFPTSGTTTYESLEQGFAQLRTAFQATAASGDLTNAGKNWRAMIRYIYVLLNMIMDKTIDWTGQMGDVGSYIEGLIDNELAQGLGTAYLTPLVVLDNTGTLLDTPFGAISQFPVRNKSFGVGFIWDYVGDDHTIIGPGGWNDTFADYTQDASGLPHPVPGSGSDRISNLLATEQLIVDTFEKVLEFIQATRQYASKIIFNQQKKLEAAWPLFASVMGSIRESLGVLPPSGAITGLYSFTDNTRGVWKAPANLRLNRVKGLTHFINAEDQENLNVDPNNGKSINAIRPFRAKGIRVWGARTLMGNSLEWRYVPVRRLFLTVEKALRDSLRSFLYEPNDRNTWVAIKGLVSSYLIRLYKAGAMSGGSPGEAFFVKIGLGETMTSTDVLEGRMILQVGIAAARPAEFIVLRFIQDLEEA